METLETKIELTEDQKVLQMIAKLATAKEAVERAEKPCYLTGGIFKYSEVSPAGPIDITIIKDERKLVEIAAFLREREANFAPAAKELGCNVNFTWFGFTRENWMADLQTRVNIIQIAQKRKELRDLEELVNTLVSPELMRKMKMAEAAEKLAKLTA
jgi:hypothetical protein